MVSCRASDVPLDRMFLIACTRLDGVSCAARFQKGLGAAKIRLPFIADGQNGAWKVLKRLICRYLFHGVPQSFINSIDDDARSNLLTHRPFWPGRSVFVRSSLSPHPFSVPPAKHAN
ncbi:unnamed protein product, partial [Phaeothamnion confervicola]